LNLDHWNLPFDPAQGGEPVEPFVIWFLELGILTVFIRFVNHLHSGFCLVKWHGHAVLLSSWMKLLMQIFEVFAGDVGIYLRR
jgi:hypothetical protein